MAGRGTRRGKTPGGLSPANRLIAGTAAWLPSAAQASPETFRVNTTADARDAHPGDGSCDIGAFELHYKP
jgi:hypothetical protein